MRLGMQGYAAPHFVLLVASTILTGCVVGPDYQAPLIALSAHWGSSKPNESTKAPVLAQWWRRLNDPLLNALIAGAVQGNLDVAAAKARIREARATRRVAIGGLFPELAGSASYTRSKSATNSLQGGSEALAGPYNQFQLGLDASWELDLFGANRRNVEAATRGVEAAEEDLRTTFLTLIGDVTSYYVQARGYQLRIALAQRSAVSQGETATLTRNKFEAGSASAVDVARAAAQASSTAANIATYKIAYAETVHRLGVLLGSEPALLTQVLSRGKAAMPAQPRRLATGIPADILLSRPDVRKAERELAQATAKIGQAEAARYPSATLTGSIATSGSQIGDLFKG